VNYLLDTRLLLWAASEPERLSPRARTMITDEYSHLWFSVASVWEVILKASLGRTDFHVDPHLLRRSLLESDFTELDITGSHVTAVAELPPVHRDPFDRILLAQARTEGMTLITADSAVARYPSDVEVI
jgi:PIN domain nuclease of toxin-antitoxin system